MGSPRSPTWPSPPPVPSPPPSARASWSRVTPTSTRSTPPSPPTPLPPPPSPSPRAQERLPARPPRHRLRPHQDPLQGPQRHGLQALRGHRGRRRHHLPVRLPVLQSWRLRLVHRRVQVLQGLQQRQLRHPEHARRLNWLETRDVLVLGAAAPRARSLLLLLHNIYSPG